MVFTVRTQYLHCGARAGADSFETWAHMQRFLDNDDTITRPRNAVVRPLIYGLGTLVLLLAIVPFGGVAGPLTAYYYTFQDQWLLIAMLTIMVTVLWMVRARAEAVAMPRYAALGIGMIVCLVCVAGHYLILQGYDVSRDEQMAVFDSVIFASRQIVAPLDAFWRDQSGVLNTDFMHPVEHRAAWTSSYLPMNAFIRAGMDWVATADLTGPLMTGVGALALWGCVRRLWPEYGEAPWVAMLLYALSGQVLFAGMTAYAMPAHLTLNLLWLWLYLRARYWADCLAIGVGFVAVGLHQPIMHPLFAAPILALLVFQRQWPRAAFYLVGYAVIGAFWMWWPSYIWSMMQSGAAVQPTGVDYLSRLTDIVVKNGMSAIPLMLLNIARFVAWNHMLLLPLAWFGVRACKYDRLAQALMVGILITLVTMLIILPYQGHGFGYRYLHGLIGSFILLAIYGWVSVKSRWPQWRAAIIWTSAATALFLIPAQAYFAHQFYGAFARADADLQSTATDYVVIWADSAPFARDLVLNRPHLDNRPLRLIGRGLTPELIGALCAKHARIALSTAQTLAPVNHLFGSAPPSSLAQRNDAFAAQLTTAGCMVQIME